MKKIFIGIDVSKKTIDASVIFPSRNDEQPIVMAYGKFDNRPGGFRKMVAMVRKIDKSVDTSEWLFCCETTGAYDNQLCDYMVDKHFDIWREHAARIATTRSEHGKDDRKDSLLIAEYAWRNRDKARLYVPASDSIKNLRQLFLFRRQLVEMRKELMTRVSGIESTFESSKILSYICKDSRKQIDKLSESIRNCEKKMQELIADNAEIKKNYAHVISVAGIGLISAVATIVYTGNFKVICSYKSFACYCGIVPFYEDSGTSVHKREYIGHKSNKMVRSYLVQAAQSAARFNDDMVKYKERMMKSGKAFGVVINNIANKLLRIVYSLVEHDCDFEKDHETKRAVQLAAAKVFA